MQARMMVQKAVMILVVNLRVLAFNEVLKAYLRD